MPILPPLESVIEIARDAGRRILDIYERDDFEVQTKQDRTPVTCADMAAHRLLDKRLPGLEPGYPVLSEEAANIPWDERRQWPRFWLVDPLDGTREFIKRNGEFTVNIALIEHGRPILGVVHAPALDQTWFAAVDQGAWLRKNQQTRSISTRSVPQRPTLLVSRSHRNQALETFLRNAPPHDAISRGSSIKYCQVASGEADLHPRTGPTSEWDTAAAQCILEQAGGVMLGIPSRAPLRYNQHESLLNPHFVVIGDPTYDWSPLLDAMS